MVDFSIKIVDIRRVTCYDGKNEKGGIAIGSFLEILIYQVAAVFCRYDTRKNTSERI